MGLTIRDVAKAAGVSTATVSNVLNKTGKVGRRTHRVVLAAVKRLGYIPDVHARHLASRDSRTLGIIVSDIENPFFPEVIKSFEARRSEEHTSELQSRGHLVCRLLLEKKKKKEHHENNIK